MTWQQARAFLSLIVGVVFSVCLGSANALAAPFNVRPFTSFGPSFGGESTLQDVLDDLTSPNLDVVADQTDAALFRQAGDEAAATLIIEIAGFANENQFGIYDATNPDLMALVFDGSAGSGARTEIAISGGDVLVGGSPLGLAGFSDTFGFYLSTPQQKTFFSEDDLNPGGMAQAVIYQGDGTTSLELGHVLGDPFTDRTFTEDMFVIAFEDLERALPWWRRGRSDSDFQDMVVLVEGVAPVPEPNSAILFGAGVLIALVAIRRELAHRV